MRQSELGLGTQREDYRQRKSAQKKGKKRNKRGKIPSKR
jgi:hypothetical protein